MPDSALCSEVDAYEINLPKLMFLGRYTLQNVTCDISLYV